MRPQTLKRKVNQAIYFFLKTGRDEKFKNITHGMIKTWRKWAVNEDDFRCGVETYGYENKESILNNMEYISDRWRCAFRLKWIIDGVNDGCFNLIDGSK